MIYWDINISDMLNYHQRNHQHKQCGNLYSLISITIRNRGGTDLWSRDCTQLWICKLELICYFYLFYILGLSKSINFIEFPLYFLFHCLLISMIIWIHLFIIIQSRIYFMCSILNTILISLSLLLFLIIFSIEVFLTQDHE